MSSKVSLEVPIVDSRYIELNHVGNVNCMAVTMSDMEIGERVYSQCECIMEYVERSQQSTM